MNSDLNMEIPLGAKGVFQNIEVLGPDGRVRRETGAFPNLITNGGLERLATSLDELMSYCQVGTSSQTPSPSDTALIGFLAATNTSTNTTGSNLTEGFAWRRMTYTFGLGAVVGNISELGIGWSSPGSLFSRALILDQFGNPTTITVLPDEQLRVTWEFRVFWPLDDVTGVLTNLGNKGGDYSFTVRASTVGAWTAGNRGLALTGNPSGSGGSIKAAWFAPSDLGGIEERPSGSAQVGFSFQYATVDPLSTRVRFSASVGQLNSAAGVQCFQFGGGAGSSQGQLFFKARVEPPILKTANDILQVDFVCTWGRAS